jgi:hypothetical protein
MTTLGDVYAALPAFRAELHQQRFEAAPASTARTFRGAFAGMRTPMSNVHATGVGIRVRDGKIVDQDFVIKVYVFDKVDLAASTPALIRKFGDIGVDVEHLPVQMALDRPTSKKRAKRTSATAATPINRKKHRPILGGVSIAPLGEAFVGTLGCFVRRRIADVEQIFALSNNHVFADTNRLPAGTKIVQPGPETAPGNPANAFATLSEFIPIRFSTETFNREVNRFDAAIARITDLDLIGRGAMLGITSYDPKLAAPQPGMAVIKSGRTTGVTSGRVTAVGVNGVQVNYGTEANPILATFNDTVEIVGDGNKPFSMPGDSGSVILEKGTGKPVALLFAGDGHTTTACSFAGVCRHFQVDPV